MAKIRGMINRIRRRYTRPPKNHRVLATKRLKLGYTWMPELFPVHVWTGRETEDETTVGKSYPKTGWVFEWRDGKNIDDAAAISITSKPDRLDLWVHRCDAGGGEKLIVELDGVTYPDFFERADTLPGMRYLRVELEVI